MVSLVSGLTDLTVIDIVPPYRELREILSWWCLFFRLLAA